jgi:hypothetical protein
LEGSAQCSLHLHRESQATCIGHTSLLAALGHAAAVGGASTAQNLTSLSSSPPVGLSMIEGKSVNRLVISLKQFMVLHLVSALFFIEVYYYLFLYL